MLSGKYRETQVGGEHQRLTQHTSGWSPSKVPRRDVAWLIVVPTLHCSMTVSIGSRGPFATVDHDHSFGSILVEAVAVIPRRGPSGLTATVQPRSNGLSSPSIVPELLDFSLFPQVSTLRSRRLRRFTRRTRWWSRSGCTVTVSSQCWSRCAPRMHCATRMHCNGSRTALTPPLM